MGQARLGDLDERRPGSESLVKQATLQDELASFYKRSGFGDVVGARTLTVPVYTGCMLVPLPNIETRHTYLKYHDLHHLLTGYSIASVQEIFDHTVPGWQWRRRTWGPHPQCGCRHRA